MYSKPGVSLIVAYGTHYHVNSSAGSGEILHVTAANPVTQIFIVFLCSHSCQFPSPPYHFSSGGLSFDEKLHIAEAVCKGTLWLDRWPEIQCCVTNVDIYCILHGSEVMKAITNIRVCTETLLDTTSIENTDITH